MKFTILIFLNSLKYLQFYTKEKHLRSILDCNKTYLKLLHYYFYKVINPSTEEVEVSYYSSFEVVQDYT